MLRGSEQGIWCSGSNLCLLFTPTSSSPAEGLAFTDAFSGALTRAAGENVSTYNILRLALL
jgi:hypothetical protein